MNTMTQFKDDRLFNAVCKPLYGPDAQPLPVEIGRAVVRDDTNETIAIAGPSFKPVQHRDVVDPLIQHLERNGYALEERRADRNSLYDLQGKKGAFIQPSFTDNGAVMRTDIITGDFVQPTGSSTYLADGPDTMLFKMSIFNSHNGSLAVRVVTSYERLICMNGMTRPEFSAGVYGKHTTGFNVKAAQAKIGNAMNAMEKDADTFGLWSKTRINVAQAEQMLKATVAKMPKKPNGEDHYSQPLLNKILGQFRYEDQTVWGLYNAVTHWQTHGERREGANVLSTTIGRETKVASMLRSASWSNMVREAA